MNDQPAIPTGPHGTALRIAIPAIPSAAQTVDYWVLTAPGWASAWDQYLLGVVRLDDDVPGFPPPRRDFDGATHEQMVVALNPEFGPYDTDRIARYFGDPPVPFLTPINHINQFIGTDDEMRQLCWYAAWGVVNAHLNPEEGQDDWLTSMTKTLAHVRGEVHAR